jgi:lipoprotein LprG
VQRRVLVPALPLLAAVALLAAGCGGSSGPSAEELVSESVAKTSAVKSFHLLVDIQNVSSPREGLGLKYVDGDVLVPDRLKGRVGGTFLGIPLSSELIVVGSDYFLKIPFTGSWRKIDVATLPAAFFDPEEGILAVISSATDLHRDGEEEVDGVPTYKLAGNVRAEQLTPLLNTAQGTRELALEFWIGQDDMLLRRVRLTGPIEPSEDDDATRTVELSAFDEPVEISPPSG